MKVFNVNKLKFTLAGLFGSMMLVGCVGESADNKSTVTNSAAATNSAQNLKDVNDEKNLWAAITGSDGVGYNSDVRFAIENNLNSDIEFMGCDGNVVQFSTQFESIIPAGFATPTKSVSDHDPRKNIIDPADMGIYDSESLQNYQFKFGTAAYHNDDRKEQCYFRIYDSKQDVYMYFKMVNDVRKFNTYSAVFNDMERPRKDAEEMVKQYDNNFWAVRAITDYATMLNTIGPTTIGILAADLGITSEKLELEVFTERYNEVLAEVVERLYEKYTALHGVSIPEAERIKGVREFYKSLGIDLRNVSDDVVKGLYKNVVIELGDDNSLRAYFYEEFSVAGRKMRQKRGFSLNNKAIKDSIISNKIFTADELSALQRAGYKDFELIELNSVTGKYQVQEVINAFGTNNSKKFINILSGNNIIKADQRAIFRLYEENRALFNSKFLAEDARLVSYSRWAKGFVTAAADFGVLVLDWFVIQPCLEMIFNNPGYGTFNTGIALLNIGEITSEDVDKWNQTHPVEQHISANTDVIQTNGNSILQNVRLSLKPNNKDGIDTNQQVNISLSKVTTPWLRVDSTNNDPWLGGVGKTNDKKGSSVFAMHISDPVDVKRFGDFNDQYNKLLYSKMGLTELANREELPAPEVKIINTSVANNGRLGVSTQGLQNFGGLSGLFVNSGSPARLSVMIPKTMLGSEVLSTSGYAAKFVPEEMNNNESEPASKFVMARSKKLFQNLNSSSDLPTLLTQFNCNAFIKTGMPCEMNLAVSDSATLSGQRSKGKLLIADAGSQTTYVPLYINYHLITEPQLFDVEQGSTGTYRVFMHNTTNSRYSKVVVSGLPTGSTVVSDSCSAGLASGADCQIDYKFSKVSKLGEYQVKITAYPSDGSDPQEFDTGDLSIRINDSW
ncbi:MAG: hypothetical protein EKK57_04515 [Proteobacteria bacterium]|nr:MAG: hypothetical protein EKK57_04515 [Pseudomonadota bacterium]